MWKLSERMDFVAEKTDFYVDGYRFGSLGDAGQAQMEQKKADYFESKLQGKDVQNILAVYNKILDERIFSTPVGWEYLKYLQEKLRASGIQENQIRPIPMYVSFIHDSDEEAGARQRINPVRKRDKIADRLKISIIVNILLGILVLAMFAITLNGKNPNILNYRKTIENEYAAWEQELTERENLVRQKEAELFTE